MPDTLLDAVKEEQTRAREAGKSARGTHASGPGNRGGCPFVPSVDIYLLIMYLLGIAGRGGLPPRGKAVTTSLSVTNFMDIDRAGFYTWRPNTRLTGARTGYVSVTTTNQDRFLSVSSSYSIITCIVLSD